MNIKSKKPLRKSEEKSKLTGKCDCIAPMTDNVGPKNQIVNLQKMAGNQAVNELLSAVAIQTKLKVSQPDDEYEKEADRIAKQVLQMEGQNVERLANKDLFSSYSSLGSEVTLVEKKQIKNNAQVDKRSLFNNSGNLMNIAPLIDTSIGSGEVISDSVRAFFEPRFGYDLRPVRVHYGVESDKLNYLFNSRAFTTGRDIFFSKEEYNTKSLDGRNLLAHELSHVIQQVGIPPYAPRAFVSEENVKRISMIGIPESEKPLIQKEEMQRNCLFLSPPWYTNSWHAELWDQRHRDEKLSDLYFNYSYGIDMSGRCHFGSASGGAHVSNPYIRIGCKIVHSQAGNDVEMEVEYGVGGPGVNIQQGASNSSDSSVEVSAYGISAGSSSSDTVSQQYTMIGQGSRCQFRRRYLLGCGTDMIILEEHPPANFSIRDASNDIIFSNLELRRINSTSSQRTWHPQNQP